MAVGVRGRGADVVACVVFQRRRVGGGIGARDIDPVGPAVGRAGPLPSDDCWFVVVFELRRHFDAGLDCCGVRGERHRARLLHVLYRDRDGLRGVDGGGRVARAVQPVVHLDVDAVAGLVLEVEGLQRPQLPRRRHDAERRRVRAAQRVRQSVVIRVLGGYGGADGNGRLRVLRYAALSVLRRRERGAPVCAEDLLRGERLRALAGAAPVRVGDAGPQVEASVRVDGRVAAGRRAGDVDPADLSVLGPRPLPGFAADVAVAVFEGGLQLHPDLRLRRGEGHDTVLLHVRDGEVKDFRGIDHGISFDVALVVLAVMQGDHDEQGSCCRFVVQLLGSSYLPSG